MRWSPPRRQETVMNSYSAHAAVGRALARRTSRRLHLVAGVVIAAAAGLAGFGLTGPAAFAMLVPPGGDATGSVTPAVAVTSSGVAEWLVALIAAGAALLGAVVVLLGHRWHLARRTDLSQAA
jgi:hypothetical protein